MLTVLLCILGLGAIGYDLIGQMMRDIDG